MYSNCYNIYQGRIGQSVPSSGKNYTGWTDIDVGVPWCGEVTVWAVVGGTVLLVVTQIVAMNTLGKEVGRSSKNDIRKNTSGETENMLAGGKSGAVRTDKFPSGFANSFRRDQGFNCHGCFGYFKDRRREDPGMEFSNRGIYGGRGRRNHQRRGVGARV